jgi:hypothetical protein
MILVFELMDCASCIALIMKKIILAAKPGSRAWLKKHSRNLHAPLCGIFCPNSVAVARYGALIRAKSPTNCDAHLAESLFQTRSNLLILSYYQSMENMIEYKTE